MEGSGRSADETPTLVGEGASPSIGERAELERGDVVGRYVVLAELGAGGMGIVYAAYDPELDRKIALKLLHREVRGDADGRSRLLREAQALAKLSHPSIVAVHDVGTVGERVWIAMEFVAGTTLRQWCRAAARSWTAVLGVMTVAGRGLAAAHQAGLVHRDFKPDNVMVTPRGVDGELRIRVMDFGLARLAGARDDAGSSTTGEADQRASKPTGVDAVAGTPAYMAAEQHAGLDADDRSDQFAFCVTLWEALYGERPFAADTFIALAAEIMDGRVRTPTDGTHVPGWLRRVLLRGLASDPSKRWPTMATLLAALERGQSRARARRVLVGVGALALGIVAVALVYQLDARREQAACDEAGAAIAEVWNDDARARLRDALIATGVSYAETTAERVTPWLTARASSWQAARTQTCMDATTRTTSWSEAALERSLWCLDERRMELEALIDELATAEASAVSRAVSAAAALPSADGCRDLGALERMVPTPIERREDMREVRRALAVVNAHDRTGAFVEGLELAHRTRVAAEALDWPPLTAASRLAEASMLERAGSYEEAERMAAAAYYEAGRAGAWDQASGAAIRLIILVGERRARLADGLAWGEHAAIAIAEAGDPEQLREARRLDSLAAVRRRAGQFDASSTLHEQALSIREQALGRDHPEVGQTLHNLAIMHYEMGAYERARSLLERALAIFEAEFGPEHPDVATTLGSLANVYRLTGEEAQVRPLLERALAIRERAFGRNHPDVAQTLSDLAGVDQARGAYPDAQALLERAVAIQEATLDTDHPDLATTLYNLAGVRYELGAHADARDLLGRVVGMQERSLGAQHPDLAQTLVDLALVQIAMGAPAEARRHLERALAIQETALGRDNTALAKTLFNLAEANASLGARAEARRLYERALAIETVAYGADHATVATSLTGLARLEIDAGEPALARARLDRAAAIYGAQEGIQDGELACIGTLARVMLAAGDGEHARPLVERALADARAGGDRIQRSEIAELDRLLGTMKSPGELRRATDR